MESVANTLRITGRIKEPLVLTMKELCEMDIEEVQDLPVICGSGTPKGKIPSLRGVLLEEVIRKADVIREDENDTKHMFILASAGDGYKVVFSWQEIFNTPVGGGVMVVIERDGQPLNTGQSLELISTEDYYTGARYVKGLQNIELVLAE